jgi:hypothetical protein
MSVPVVAGRMVTVSNGPGQLGLFALAEYQNSARKLLALFSGGCC